jgi:hypothetical protein
MCMICKITMTVPFIVWRFRVVHLTLSKQYLVDVDVLVPCNINF